jgi:lipopolysaccharide transport system ATP-binding protein
MSSESTPPPLVVSATDVGKCYHIYDRPQDRLKQALFRWRRQFYREFWALRGVSFEVRRGEALGIIGRNGSGKSTLLQIIAGTLQPTEGEVRTVGRVAALLELGSGFNPEFTGRENVYTNGAILGLSRRQVDERFDDIAAFADIGEFLEQPVKTYSSGMLVRLAFAVQVQMEPDILIVDEALAVGDLLFQKRCFQRIEELRANGVTLLFVSHDQEIVRTLTNRALLLHEGRVRAYGASAEVVLDYRRLLHEEEKRWYAWQFEKATQRQKAARPAAAAPTPDTPRRSDAFSFGDLDAEVVRAEVLDHNRQSASLFHPGERLIIRVQVRLHRDLTHLNVGIRIRSKEGVKVYSWGTFNQDVVIWSEQGAAETFWERRFARGELVTVEFDCEGCLGHGFYEVQALVAEEQRRFFGHQRMLHWRDEAAFFHVHVVPEQYFFGGLCDLRARATVCEVIPADAAIGSVS